MKISTGENFPIYGTWCALFISIDSIVPFSLHVFHDNACYNSVKVLHAWVHDMHLEQTQVGEDLAGLQDFDIIMIWNQHIYTDLLAQNGDSLNKVINMLKRGEEVTRESLYRETRGDQGLEIHNETNNAYNYTGWKLILFSGVMHTALPLLLSGFYEKIS